MAQHAPRSAAPAGRTYERRRPEETVLYSGHIAFFVEGSSMVRTLDPNAGVAWGYRERRRSEVLAWVRTT